MRVVNHPLFYDERVPVKRGVAVRAPHLGAPRNLENHGSAVGTRLGVLLQEFHRFDVIGLALVVLLLDFVALAANLVFAHLAVPLGGQKPATLADGALAHKLAPLRRNLLATNVIYFQVKLVNLVRECLDAFVVRLDDAFTVLSVREYHLRIGQEALFAFEEYVFAVVLELVVPERLCTCRIYEFAVPYILALHTVRIGGNLREILLDALSTTLKVTVIARDFYPQF